jgi:hypothetical protein
MSGSTGIHIYIRCRQNIVMMTASYLESCLLPNDRHELPGFASITKGLRMKDSTIKNVIERLKVEVILIKMNWIKE